MPGHSDARSLCCTRAGSSRKTCGRADGRFPARAFSEFKPRTGWFRSGAPSDFLLSPPCKSAGTFFKLVRTYQHKFSRTVPSPQTNSSVGPETESDNSSRIRNFNTTAPDSTLGPALILLVGARLPKRVRFDFWLFQLHSFVGEFLASCLPFVR